MIEIEIPSITREKEEKDIVDFTETKLTWIVKDNKLVGKSKLSLFLSLSSKRKMPKRQIELLLKFWFSYFYNQNLSWINITIEKLENIDDNWIYHG